MTALELENYLHAHITLSCAMQVTVIEACAEQVVLAAPLAPNINHQETVFGGSASALAILAAWSLLHTRLDAAGMSARLVIQRNTMTYERPMAGDFMAKALAPSPAAWEAFERTFRRRGRARIAIASTLWYQGHEAGRFDGEFVALRKPQA